MTRLRAIALVALLAAGGFASVVTSEPLVWAGTGGLVVGALLGGDA